MNWKTLLLIAGLFGLGAVALGGGDETESERKRIRGHFDVTPDCQITWRGKPEDAAAFWQANEAYLRKMIDLAATLHITEPAGVTAYIMLALFPECDQTQEPTNSFRIVMEAMGAKVDSLMK